MRAFFFIRVAVFVINIVVPLDVYCAQLDVLGLEVLDDALLLGLVNTCKGALLVIDLCDRHIKGTTATCGVLIQAAQLNEFDL